MERGQQKNKNKACWELFNCQQKYRERCPVYRQFKMSKSYFEGWLDIDINSLEGGPAKRGPCAECPIFLNKHPELAKEIYKYFGETLKIKDSKK